MQILHDPNLERKNTMKSKLARFVLLTHRINRQHIQLAFAVLALVMLVMGGGAPDDGSGFNR